MSTLFQRLMKYYGLTTRTLGAKAGVSRQAISQVAHGQLPRVDVAILIAHEFRLTVEELWPVQNPDYRRKYTETARFKKGVDEKTES